MHNFRKRRKQPKPPEKKPILQVWAGKFLEQMLIKLGTKFINEVDLSELLVQFSRRISDILANYS